MELNCFRFYFGFGSSNEQYMLVIPEAVCFGLVHFHSDLFTCDQLLTWLMGDGQDNMDSVPAEQMKNFASTVITHTLIKNIRDLANADANKAAHIEKLFSICGVIQDASSMSAKFEDVTIV